MTELSLSGTQPVHKSTATVTLVVLALAPRSLGCLRGGGAVAMSCFRVSFFVSF